MSEYQFQLLLGFIALLFWTAAFLRWYAGNAPTDQTIIAAIVSAAAGLVILIGGSLTLLGLLSPEAWSVVGTGGRLVVVVGGVTALLTTNGEPR